MLFGCFKNNYSANYLGREFGTQNSHGVFLNIVVACNDLLCSFINLSLVLHRLQFIKTF